MNGFPISSQVSWVHHYEVQKLYFSKAVENVRLHSGDGFIFTIPTHALLASSNLVKSILPCGEVDQDIILPSVIGKTLLPLVELLRCGMTTITGKIGSINLDSIKEIQEVMKMLSIEGCVTLMKNTDSSSSSSNRKCEQVNSKKRRFDLKNQDSTSIVQVMVECTPRYEQILGDYLTNEDHDVGVQDAIEVDYAEICKEKKITEYDCNVCGKKFSKKDTWKAHMRYNHNDALFQCAHCSKKFILEHTMKLHVEAAHMGSVTCDYCPKVYRNKEALRDHIRHKHRDQMIPCRKCNSMFIDADTLSNHQKKIHPEIDGPFTCDECRTTFEKSYYLRRHLRSVHSGKRYTCPECKSTYSTKQNLARHVRFVHGNKCEEVVGITESHEHDGNETMNAYVVIEAEHSDKDNNMIMEIQNNNTTEQQ